MLMNLALHVLCITAFTAGQASQEVPVEWDQWVSANAAGIVAPNNLGDGAKAALRRIVGKKRVVLLGELTHGDGTAFELKVSLIKFLHQEMGFKTLIWESGLYDCRAMDAQIDSGKPIQDVAREGIFRHWSESVEALPVFEYARSSVRSQNPLRMAGFDLQPSGRASAAMVNDLLSWFDRDTAFSQDEASRIRKGELGTQALEDRYKKHRKALDARWPKDGFRQRILVNVVHFEKLATINAEAQRQGKSIAEGYNLRERVNAQNLDWLLQGPLKGQRVIVWAHNAHIFKGLPGREAGIDASPVANDFDSTGRLLAKNWRKAMAVIGVMASRGTWSWMGGAPIAYRTPGPGSIEACLEKAGKDLAVFDLKTAPRTALVGTLDQQNPFPVAMVWPAGYDAVLYVKEMKPRTQRQN